MKIGVLFAGRIDDGGFMESGYRGLMRARDEYGFEATWIDAVAPRAADLASALRSLARSGVDLAIAHGGQNDAAAVTVAAEYPHTPFVVTQGSVSGSNLSSYEVRQEQSAYLAGVAAASLTKSGRVGHISGIRVRPGLLGRAAFVSGVKACNASVEVLTTFCGSQDDVALAERVAEREIDAGADIIFTMLNAAMPGAIAACRRRGIRQIGNVRDWVDVDPRVFIASAFADVGVGVYRSCSAWATHAWRPHAIHRIGVEDPAAVRLCIAGDVPNDVRASLDAWRDRLRAGAVEPAGDYAGPELAI